MADQKLDRIQELVNEIKIVREVNSTLHKECNSLQTRIYDKDCEIKNLNSKIENLRTNVSLLETEKAAILKKMENKTKALENEIRRNGIFNQKVMATSRTKKEHTMIQEMDSLRKVNTTLLGFVEILSKTYNFDKDLLKTLANIAEGVDDRIIQLFLDGLIEKSKECDIEMATIENVNK